jgi:hypothetical protein
MTTFTTNSSDRRPPRVLARPNPADWDQDEILTLEEAAALFWPCGPLTVRSLRTAVRDGDLGVTWIAGKLFTSPRAINDMTKCSINKPQGREAVETTPAEQLQSPPEPSLTEAAQKLMCAINAERARLKPRLNRMR